MKREASITIRTPAGLKLELEARARWEDRSLADEVVSDAILSEYQEVFGRPKLKIRPEDSKELLDFLKGGVLVKGSLSAQRLPDPKDQPFLDAAIEAGASVIVSGNLQDFPAKICHPVKAVSPRDALALLAKGS